VLLTRVRHPFTSCRIPLIDLPVEIDKQRFVLQPSSEVPGWNVLQPTLLLSPEEALRLPLLLWPTTNGSLPSIAVSTPSENPIDDVRMGLLRVSVNVATSGLLRTWATRVQEFLQAQSPGSQDPVAPAAVPCSTFQATESLVVLANYLALSLNPTAMSYNDLGIVLSSANGPLGFSQPQSSRSGPQNETTGCSLSRSYFEAGLEIDPYNAYLLVNLGSYWKKEGNYKEAIRFVSPPPGYHDSSVRQVLSTGVGTEPGIRCRPCLSRTDSERD
jgi:hypothetical protein